MFEWPALKKNPVVIYIMNFGRKATATVLLLLCSILLTTVVLYLCQMAWYAYTDTPIGQRFIVSFPQKARIIIAILEKNFLNLSIQMTVSAFVVCITIGVVFQLFHIIRYLFIPFGIFKKFVFWGLPLTVAVAEYAQYQHGFYPWQSAYLLSFIPTMCLFASCLNFANELLPEIGDLIRRSG